VSTILSPWTRAGTSWACAGAARISSARRARARRMNTLCPGIWEAQAMSAQTVEAFYAAFNRRDGAAMAALYAPDGRFRDPVFGELSGTEAGAMWRMLTGRAEDLRVDLVEHDDRSARWIAHYTFTQTGRPVVNDVRARFAFRDGLIVEHIDTFS